MSEAPYPDWLLAQIHEMAPHVSGEAAAQLLWQRGIQKPEAIAGFLDPDQYSPTGPEAFGQEMEWAIDRLERARCNGEAITIWGDFDADGVTATAVLWEGLGQFLPPAQLNYVIPNRLTDSHGLNQHGIEALHRQGTALIVTCDTGSTNLTEIELANHLGIDVIVTDHHTLPITRPPVVAMINPRQFAVDHPLATLSGVAVAYKLVEAWYNRCPQIPQQSLKELLDLVAIGLIADLVELKQDCRYLAQRGLQKLKTRLQDPRSRPGVAKLLTLCQKAGDRPTDISFGIGPRINAVSRIQGDASFCVELLTSRDQQRCEQLAIQTELANSRRKELQQRIKQEVTAEVEKLDLSSTQVIVIAKRQWPLGVLGLVAGEIAQTWKRPTILMQIETDESGMDIARGSARSVRGIDLYVLMANQSHLFIRFGGHPFAAGLSLRAEDVNLLSQALNHAIRLYPPRETAPSPYDLQVTVNDLGRSLFKELQLLEPYGMGNRIPRLFIKNAWFEDVSHRKLRDRNGKKLKYLQARFTLKDDSSSEGFPGIWWEQSEADIPTERCDVLAELDFNNYHRKPEIRILQAEPTQSLPMDRSEPAIEILDYRNQLLPSLPDKCLVLYHCPRTWDELGQWIQRSRTTQQPLVFAYTKQIEMNPASTWKHLVGIAKTAIHAGKTISRSHLGIALNLPDNTLNLGLNCLGNIGISVQNTAANDLRFSWQRQQTTKGQTQIYAFLERVEEERFQQQYFACVSKQSIVNITMDSTMNNSWLDDETEMMD